MFETYGGIFAAGDGTRLQAAFPGVPKPLVPVAGVPLIVWAARQLSAAGAKEITVLLNSAGKSARERLKKEFPEGKFTFIVKNTKTSYESFRLLSQALAQKSDGFVLSAVDTLCSPADLREFAVFSHESKFDAVLGITDKIEDEKPLWADVDEKGRITALGEKAAKKIYATSGVYYVTRRLAEEMPDASEYKALRHYLSDIVSQGKAVGSAYMPQSVDVDDAADVPLAEAFAKKHFLTQGEQHD